MATFEPSSDLDPRVAQAIQDAMDALRGELLGHLAPRAARPATGVSGGGDEGLTRLEAAVETLDRAATQSDLLNSLLQEAGAFADRALFLVRNGEQLEGWAAFGFVGSEADVDRVVVDCPREVAQGSPVDSPEEGQELCEQMLAPAAADSAMIPFMLRGKAAGALYADRAGAAKPLNRAALRLLCYVSAQALETLPLRHGGGADDAAIEEPPAAAPQDPPAVEDVEAELDRMIEEVVPVAPGAAPEDVDVEAMIQEVERDAGTDEDRDILSIRHEVASTAFAPEEEVDEDLDLEVSEAAMPDDDDLEVADRAATVETEFVPSRAETVEVSRAIEDAEVAPPDDLQGPGWAFSGGESISDDNRHEEARRLARLLVTEIKLYNEEKVREGRENHDVYDQLRDDIERSRRIYNERIDDEIRQEADYFQEEILRILAGGDPAVLGA